MRKKQINQIPKQLLWIFITVLLGFLGFLFTIKILVPTILNIINFIHLLLLQYTIMTDVNFKFFATAIILVVCYEIFKILSNIFVLIINGIKYSWNKANLKQQLGNKK